MTSREELLGEIADTLRHTKPGWNPDLGSDECKLISELVEAARSTTPAGPESPVVVGGEKPLRQRFNNFLLCWEYGGALRGANIWESYQAGWLDALASPPPREEGINSREFLAARLRRLFVHFDYPVPTFAASDDAALVNIAGSLLGGLLTRLNQPQQAPKTLRTLTAEELEACGSPFDSDRPYTEKLLAKLFAVNADALAGFVLGEGDDT